MIQLRTFTYIDVFQPQTASFIATVAQGYLPIEGQASLYIEIAPGIEINRITDIALKHTDVRPGMQIVERAYGTLELHANDQGEIRAAGNAILQNLQLQIEDRLQPRILTSQIITGIDPHHTMLINRTRHGQMILKGQSFLTLEVHPAGYALLAANEAEKHSPIQILEIRAFGAFGRVYLAGGEEEIQEAQKAISDTLSSLTGITNTEVEKYQ